MAELIYRHMYKVDVANDPLIRRDVGALLGLYDKAANRFGVELYDNGTALTLSGKTVTGYMIRPDGKTVDISGTASGNQAYVELKENCYLYDGAFTLSLKVGSQTVLICDGQIAVTRTGTTVNGNEVINTVSSAEMLGGKPPEAFVAVNLLDNSNFLNPVNQRGATANAKSGEYLIDRWRCESANNIAGTVLVSEDGITLAPTSINYCGIEQKLERYSELVGNTCTAALCVNDTWHVATLTIGSTPAGGAIFDNGLRLYSTGSLHFLIRSDAGSSAVTIQKVALYEGAYTADTLPLYVPKPYAVELVECQRYYVRYAATSDKAVMLAVSATNGNQVYTPIHLPQPMVGQVTMTYSNLELYPYVGGAVAITAAGIYNQSEDHKTLLLYCNHDANNLLPAKSNCALRITAGGCVEFAYNL